MMAGILFFKLWRAKQSSFVSHRGPFTLNFQKRTAFLNGKPLDLSPLTFDYLALLLRCAPDIVPYETLVSVAPGFRLTNREAQETARWRVNLLREALKARTKKSNYIREQPGEGFRIVY